MIGIRLIPGLVALSDFKVSVAGLIIRTNFVIAVFVKQIAFVILLALDSFGTGAVRHVIKIARIITGAACAIRIMHNRVKAASFRSVTGQRITAGIRLRIIGRIAAAELIISFRLVAVGIFGRTGTLLFGIEITVAFHARIFREHAAELRINSPVALAGRISYLRNNTVTVRIIALLRAKRPRTV